MNDWNVRVFWGLEKSDPDRLALVPETGSGLSYGQLDALAEGWCDRIRAAGGGAGAMAALEIDISAEAIAAYLGCLRAGCPVLLAEPGTLTADSAMQGRWQPEIHIRRHSGSLRIAEPAEAPPGDGRPAPHPDLALLLSTSGSTGDPKLVRLSAANIGANARSIVEYLGIRPGDVAATTLPLFYSYGLSVLNSCLEAGATLYLTQRSVTDPCFWSGAQAAGVTSLALVPHQCETIAHAPEAIRDLPSLRYVTQAGGKLSPQRVGELAEMGRRQGWDMFVMYGQTEAAPRMSYVPPEALPEAADTIGRPIPGGRIWLADPRGDPIEASDTPGELVYEGPNVMLGYAETRADLSKGREIHALWTGDIAERTPEGLFRIVGRAKRFVKLYGMRLNLDQIERFLDRLGRPAMAEAVDDRLVLLHTDARAGSEIAGLVADAFKLQPSDVLTGPLASLPLLPSGKTDRRALQQAAREIVARQQDGTGEASDIRAVIREVTRSWKVSGDDSFSTLGGDSLGYLRVQMALERLMGRVPRGWEKMPIRMLEDRIRAAGQTRDGAMSRIGSDVVLRVLAISLIVVQHATTTYPLQGGTWILVLLMGMTAERFQLQSVVDGRPWRLLAKMLYPILPLYFCIVIAYALLRDPISTSYFTLTRNYDPLAEVNVIGIYWFVALYVQLVVLLALLSSIGPLRRRMRDDGWTMAKRMFLVSVLIAALQFLLAPTVEVTLYGEPRSLSLFPVLHVPEQGLLECLPIFFSGWLLAVAKTPRQRWASLVASFMALLLFTLVSAYTSSAVFLLIALVVAWSGFEIPMPAWLAQTIRKLASVSLFVFLTHMVPVYVLVNMLGLRDWLGQGITAAMVLVASFCLALLVEVPFFRIDGIARRNLGRLRDLRG